MHDRHALNVFLKESGFGTSGDLVFLEPARSETMEVRRSEKAVVATISTAARDRHGDVIDPRGVRLERFRKNPVVLYAHDYDGLPVARSLWERVREGEDGPELVAKPQFHMDTELSREVWALVEKGVLSAWSVGFIPELWEPIDGDGFSHHGAHGEHGERRTSGERPTRDAVGETADATTEDTESDQRHGERTPRRVVGMGPPSSVNSVPSVVKNAGGFRVKRWDLLEYSCVPVAANFEALTRELKARRITAPALVKTLAPLGMREPDLVPQPVRHPRHSSPQRTQRAAEDCCERTPKRAVGTVLPSSAYSAPSAVKNAVARGFDRWLARARGGEVL